MAKFLEEKEILEGFFPKFEISRITLESTNSTLLKETNPHISVLKRSGANNVGHLVVTVDFIIKEKIRNEGIGALFDSKEFQKYLSMNIKQVVGRLDHGKLRFIPSETRMVNVPLENSNKNFRVFESIDENGAANYRYFHSIKFETKDQNPDYLSYVFIPVINKDKFNADFNVNITMTRGKSENVLVIDKRKGERVRHHKVQDYRHTKEIEKRFIDLSDADKTLNSPMMKYDRFSPDSTMARRPANYFSNIHISRDLEENARFFFALDYKKFLLEKSVFGGFFDKAGAVSFYKTFKIRTMNIIRRRVKVSEGINKVLTESQRIVAFSNEEKEKIIVSTKEERPKKINNVVSGDGNSYVGTIKEINLHLLEDEKDVRYFTGIDKEVKNLTHGHYQYGVEIEVNDSTRERFISFRNTLVDSSAILKTYLSEASRIGRKKIFPKIDAAHIKNERETHKTEKSMRGNYDPVINKYSDNFVQEQLSKYHNSKNIIAPWILVPFNYNKILKMVSNVTSAEANSIRQFLVSIIHPATGSPEGIQTAIKLVEQLAGEVGKIIGLYKEATLGDSKKSWAGGTAFKKNITLKKWFTNELFDASMEKGVGLDYFSLDVYDKETNEDGLKIIAGKDYEERIKKETEKYYISDNEDLKVSLPSKNTSKTKTVDTTRTTKFSFLSPSVIHLKNPGKVLAISAKSTSKITREQMIEADVSSAKRNTLSRGTRTTSETAERTYQIAAETALAEIGVSIVNENTENSAPLTERETATTTPNISSTSTSLPATLKGSGDEVGIDKVETQKVSPSKEISSKQNPGFASHSLITSVNAFSKSKNERPNEQGSAKSRYTKKDIIVKVNTGEHSQETDINTIKNFDLKSKDNIFSLSEKDESIVSSIALGTIAKSELKKGKGSIGIEEVIRLLPNQIKALMMETENSAIVYENWQEKDPMKNITDIDANVFRYNYLLLESVEVLSGYEESEEGKQIKLENWVALTEEVYNNSVGKILLCRLKDYQNKHLGIVREERIDLPVYNEYFFISPKGEIEIEEIPSVDNEIVTIEGAVFTDFLSLTEPESELSFEQIPIQAEINEISFTPTRETPTNIIGGLKAKVEESEFPPDERIQSRIIKLEDDRITPKEIEDNSRLTTVEVLKSAEMDKSIAFEKDNKEDLEDIIKIVQESNYTSLRNQMPDEKKPIIGKK